MRWSGNEFWWVAWRGAQKLKAVEQWKNIYHICEYIFYDFLCS